MVNDDNIIDFWDDSTCIHTWFKSNTFMVLIADLLRMLSISSSDFDEGGMAPEISQRLVYRTVSLMPVG